MEKELILETIKDLPPFPQTALKVIRAARNPDCSAQDLVNIIQYDPNLTASILKIANSAYFGLQVRVTSLRQAVAYLGDSTIINILFLGGCMNYFQGDFPGYGINGKQLLEHSITTALMGRILGEAAGIQNTSVIFTAGLLHDIGKVILSRFVKDKYEDIMRLVTQNNYSFIRAEREILGVDHAQVGGEIVQKWNIPQEIAVPITFHHQPEAAPADSMGPYLVYLSDRVQVLISGTPGADQWSFKAVSHALQRCGLTDDDMDASMMQLREASKNIHQLLSL